MYIKKKRKPFKRLSIFKIETQSGMGGGVELVKNNDQCDRLKEKYCIFEKLYGGTILRSVSSSANCCCDARQPCVVSHSLRTFLPSTPLLFSAIPRNGRHTYTTTTTTFGTNNNNHGTTSSKRSLFFFRFYRCVAHHVRVAHTQPTFSSINAAQCAFSR